MHWFLPWMVLGLSSVAHAHDVDVDDLTAIAEDLDRTLEALDAQRRDGSELLPREAVLEAYQNAAAAFLLDQHDEAAQGFFVLRSLVDDPSLQAEADWYLAQSLEASGHDRLAEAILREIVGLDGADTSSHEGARHPYESHPFAPEAAAALLELTATLRPATAFAPLHEELDGRGLVDRSDAILYSVGRSWYLVGRHREAREALTAVDPAHPVSQRAGYLLATLDLVEGRLDDASARFAAVADSDIANSIDRHVVDLARLAVARIAYEQGDFDGAADHYARIAGDSPVLEEALYELAWAHIAREDDEAALRAVELFLLAFPDAARAGRMTVARGHLQMRQGAWEQAAWTYEGIDADFEGIEADLAATRASDLLEVLDDDTGLPPWVQQRLVGHPELRRAVTVQAVLEATRVQLVDADVLAAELEITLRGDVALKRHRRLRSGVFAELLRIAQAALDVVRLQIDTLAHSGRQGRARARALRPELVAAQDRLDRLRKRDAVQLGIKGARPDVVAAGQYAWSLVEGSALDDAHQHGGLDDVVARLASHQADATRQLEALDLEAARALEPLEAQLARHQEDLAVLHVAHVGTAGQARSTQEAAISAGVAEVEAILDDGIREARAGMADAAFSELQETIAGREALQMERDELLEQLEQLFATARSRL